MLDALPAYPPPPTEDDLPWEDGVPVDSTKHDLVAHLCQEILNLHWQGRDDYYIGVNLGLYYSVLQDQQRFRAPDVMIVLDTHRRPMRKSWVIWQEDGQGPDVIIEVLSESTAAVDRGDKMRIYAKLVKVPEYYLYDPEDGALEGYQLDMTTMEYRRMAADGQGRLPSSRLKMTLGTERSTHNGYEGPWLRFFQPDGQMLPTEAEARAAIAKEKQLVQQEKQTLAERLAAYEKKFGPLS